jgi:DNA-binding beta-propeller fold protein YncE
MAAMSKRARLSAVALLLTGCGAGSIGDSASAPKGGGNLPSPGTPGGPSPAPAPTPAPGAMQPPAVTPPLPPEMEERRSFEAPQAGARYVYVANPRRDTVAVIDSTTLAIRLAPTGDAPTYLATVPGKDVAIVLNVGSRDATILRTEAGMTRTSTVPVVPGANALAVAPDGVHVVAWYDSHATGGGAGLTGSFQDVSVLTLGVDDRSLAFSVGFRPSEVSFSSDGSAAFVVTDDGVSILRFADLTAPAVAPLVRVDDGAGDVSVTPDGRFALARREGASAIQVVDLSSRASTTVELGSPVTDLDLSPAADFAVAVLRDAHTVVRIPLPAGFTDPSVRRATIIEGEAVGSATITPDGKTAVLYTTAAPVDRLVLLDLDTQAVRPVRLRKGVRAVAVAPDSKTVLVVHTKDPGSPAAAGLTADQVIARSYGYTVVDLPTAFAKLQLTPAPVGELAVTPDATRAFLLLRDDGASIRLAQRIQLASFIVDDFPLGSPPLSLAALVDSKRVFVSQEHPEGRISFIQWETGAIESVTGFELNGRIVP